MDQDFVKQGSNIPLLMLALLSLLFTVVMCNLYWGKEMQNLTYVDQTKNYNKNS